MTLREKLMHLNLTIFAAAVSRRWREVLEVLAKKCDRCGRLYEHYDVRKVFPKSLSNSLELRDTDCRGSIWPRDRFDLCEDCMTKLESFLYGGADK